MTGGTTVISSDAVLATGTAFIIGAAPYLVSRLRRNSDREHAEQLKDILVRDLVLGDPARGMPSMRDQLSGLTRLIEDRTRPIQPETNGGASLVDLHDKLDEQMRRTRATADQVSRQLEEHRREVQRDLVLDRKAAREEQTAMWRAIEQIGKNESPLEEL